MSYLIVYDIGWVDNRVRLRVNRLLHRMGATRLQHSVWESEDFEELQGLALSIKATGGRAIILKKRVAWR